MITNTTSYIVLYIIYDIVYYYVHVIVSCFMHYSRDTATHIMEYIILYIMYDIVYHYVHAIGSCLHTIMNGKQRKVWTTRHCFPFCGILGLFGKVVQYNYMYKYFSILYSVIFFIF